MTEAETPPHPDSSLGQLRSQIKKVMIPLLIRIFELKFAAQQTKMPPSRLQPKREESPEEIIYQLKVLQEDLKLLELWCVTGQKQIERALSEAMKSKTDSPSSFDIKPSSEEESPHRLHKFLKQ